jgi:hypothetical protein
MDLFNPIGPHLVSEFYILTLNGGYAAAFRAFNTCPMTLHARACGFRPIFCMTNVICQKSTWGVNNHRFVSVNQGSVSFLCMLGYWKK